MVQMTLQVPEELAKRIQPIQVWLPAILEISLVGCKTPAAAEVIQFFSGNPTPQQVLGYHASERAQMRSRRLLALNSAGVLGKAGQHELDELERIEHTIIMLKAELAQQLQIGPLVQFPSA